MSMAEYIGDKESNSTETKDIEEDYVISWKEFMNEDQLNSESWRDWLTDVLPLSNDWKGGQEE